MIFVYTSFLGEGNLIPASDKTLSQSVTTPNLKDTVTRGLVLVSS
jgi:hypothetical protein